jgi:uncharacterized membrane protein (UPF0127 family)
MRITNSTKNTILAKKAVIADTLFTRAKGLLGRSALEEGSALILKPCNSVHTFFMRFAIDVLFVDNKNRVIKTLSNLKPFRFSPLYYNAALVIELPTGTIQESATSTGDILTFEN